MDRGECESELQEQGMVDGRFVVRLKTEKPNSVVYALSYGADGEFYHHLLTRKKGRKWTLNDRTWCLSSLVTLVSICHASLPFNTAAACSPLLL